ncbi:MAG: hypothetical protein CL912_14685 [Deltaproteobacteria bacterium]|nr:hypothetical protein [Deltaproteobacteria bacterium]
MSNVCVELKITKFSDEPNTDLSFSVNNPHFRLLGKEDEVSDLVLSWLHFGYFVEARVESKTD